MQVGTAIITSIAFAVIVPLLALLPSEGAALVVMLIGCIALYALGAFIAYWYQERRAARTTARFRADSESTRAVAERGAIILRERGIEV